MKHLKLYEEFNTYGFSNYYEEISVDQYKDWRIGWLQGDTYLVWDDDIKSNGFYQKINQMKIIIC